MRNNTGAQILANQTGTNYNKQKTQQDNNARDRYQPIPDGRFYTKANFFTLGDRKNAELNASRDESDNPAYQIRPSNLTDTGGAFPENGAVPFP